MKNLLVKNIKNINISYTYLPFIISFCILIATFLGYLGRYSWFCDLFSHFKKQYFFLSISSSLIILLLAIIAKKDNLKCLNNAKHANKDNFFKKKKLYFIFILSLIPSTINSFEILPYYIKSTSSINNSKKIRFMHINVETRNCEYKKVEDYILKINPDVLLLLEVSEKWIQHLPEIRKKYQFFKIYPQNDNFGIALYSKIKSTNINLHFFGKFKIPYLTATFKVQDKDIFFIGIHTLPPIGHNNFQHRNKMLKEIPKWIKESNTNTCILMGDLNITQWSYFFQKLLNQSNLRNSQLGFGTQTSWPSHLRYMQIPIDHCLHSKDLEIKKRIIGPNVGSDHFPLVIDVLFKKNGK